MEFVRLGAVQEVVFLGAFLDRALDGQAHRDKADAVARILGIEARLIKVESPPVTQAIECAGGFSVESQNEEAKPAAAESQRRELFVESDMPGSVERIGA